MPRIFIIIQPDEKEKRLFKRFGEGSNDMIRDFLREAYESIRSGEFDREWRKEQDEYHLEHLDALRRQALSADVTQAEDRLFGRLKGIR